MESTNIPQTSVFFWWFSWTFPFTKDFIIFIWPCERSCHVVRPREQHSQGPEHRWPSHELIFCCRSSLILEVCCFLQCFNLGVENRTKLTGFLFFGHLSLGILSEVILPGAWKTKAGHFRRRFSTAALLVSDHFHGHQLVVFVRTRPDLKNQFSRKSCKTWK